MSSKTQVAFRLDDELLAEVDAFLEFINGRTDFPGRSRTDIVHFLLRRGLKSVMTSTPPCTDTLERFRAAGRARRAREDTCPDSTLTSDS